MAKRKGIQWTEKQKALLARTVKNFNAKITRELNKAKKKGSFQEAVNYLPSYIRQSDLKKYIATAQDLKKITSMYARFSRVNAATVLKDQAATKWEYTEARRLQKARNNQIGDITSRFDPLKGNTQRLRDEGVAYSQTDLAKKNRKQLERYITTQLGSLTTGGQLTKDKQYQTNFLKRVTEVEGISDTQRKILQGFLNAINPDILRRLWYESDTIHIGYLYPVPGEEYNQAQQMIDEIMVLVSQYEQEGVDVFTERFDNFRSRSFFTKRGASLDQVFSKYKG